MNEYRSVEKTMKTVSKQKNPEKKSLKINNKKLNNSVKKIHENNNKKVNKSSLTRISREKVKLGVSTSKSRPDLLSGSKKIAERSLINSDQVDHIIKGIESKVFTKELPNRQSQGKAGKAKEPSSHFLYPVFKNPNLHKGTVKENSSSSRGIVKRTSNISLTKHIKQNNVRTKLKNNSLVLSMIAKNIDKINKEESNKKPISKAYEHLNDQKKEEHKKYNENPNQSSFFVDNRLSGYSPKLTNHHCFEKNGKMMDTCFSPKMYENQNPSSSKLTSIQDPIKNLLSKKTVKNSILPQNSNLGNSKSKQRYPRFPKSNKSRKDKNNTKIKIEELKDNLTEEDEHVLPRFIEMFNKMYKDQETEDRRNLRNEIKHSLLEKQKVPETTLQYYQIIKLIGKGSFGRVYLGLQKLTNRLVAIKCLEKEFIKEDSSKRKIKSEIEILNLVHGHPNIIKLLEVFENSKFVFFVMEYAANNDLLQLLKEKKQLEEDEARIFFYQIASGVRQCHRKGVVHRDIKLDNILIDENNICKICDFGVSRKMRPNELVNEQCGTPAYLAPEIISDKGYKNFSVDIWSLGVLLYCMISGQMPFRADTKETLNQLILEAHFEYPIDIIPSEDLKDLISKMIERDPDRRITIEGIFQHNWLSSIDRKDDLIKAIRQFEDKNCRFLNKMNEDLNDFALDHLSAIGFDKETLKVCLNEKILNHATACYHLIQRDFQ